MQGHLGRANLALVDDKGTGESGEAPFPPFWDGTRVCNGHEQQTAGHHHVCPAADPIMKKGWRGGAGSNFDAWLTTAAAQVSLMPACQPPVSASKQMLVLLRSASRHEVLAGCIDSCPEPATETATTWPPQHADLLYLRPVASDSTLCLQIGQVMLALPNAVAVAGMRAAVPLIFVYACLSIYTIHLLTSCYAQLKLRKVCGCWFSADSACMCSRGSEWVAGPLLSVRVRLFGNTHWELQA